MLNNSQPRLDQEILNTIRTEAPRLTEAIIEAARSSRGNEAQFAMRCDLIFAEFAKRAHLHWQPLGERSVAWLEGEDKRRGKIDRLFNRVVVEYKKPGLLNKTNNATANRSALTQLRNYLTGLKDEEGWTSIAGVVTDGQRFIFCRFSADQAETYLWPA